MPIARPRFSLWLCCLLLLSLWLGSWEIPAAAAQSAKGRDKTEKLSAAERAWLEKQSKALRDLPPEEQQRVRQNLRRWTQLPEEQRAKLRERWQAWQKLRPEQRQRLKQRFEEWQKLPPEERQRLRDILRRLSPEEQQRFRDTWRRATPEERHRLLEERKSRRDGPAERSPLDERR